MLCRKDSLVAIAVLSLAAIALSGCVDANANSRTYVLDLFDSNGQDLNVENLIGLDANFNAVQANGFFGDGSGLTGITSTPDINGESVLLEWLDIDSNLMVGGDTNLNAVYAINYFGDGSGLTGVTATADVNGQDINVQDFWARDIDVRTGIFSGGILVDFIVDTPVAIDGLLIDVKNVGGDLTALTFDAVGGLANTVIKGITGTASAGGLAVDELYGVEGIATSGGFGSNANNVYAGYFNATAIGGLATNVYGIYATATGGTNRHGLYVADGNAYIADSLYVGSDANFGKGASAQAFFGSYRGSLIEQAFYTDSNFATFGDFNAEYASTFSPNFTGDANFGNNLQVSESLYIDKNINAYSGIFNWIDKIEQTTDPSTPPTNTLRLYVEEIEGFSFFKYIDDTGMKRALVRDSVILVKNTRGSTIAANRIVWLA